MRGALMSIDRSIRDAEAYLCGQIETVAMMIRRLALADTWLHSKCDEHLALNHGWHVAVAVALLGGRNEPPSLVKRVVEGSLAGRITSELTEPRMWFQSLPVQVLEYIEDLAIAETDMLLESLRRLERSLQDDLYQHQFGHLLIAVDNLYCLQVYLADAKSTSRLTLLLDMLDRAGQAYPPRKVCYINEEQLRRTVMPEWWTVYVW
jgi:hypothetical protein